MGNSNCSKCFQEFEGSHEADLKPSIILKAFSNFRDSTAHESSKYRPTRKHPSISQPLSTPNASIIKIQSMWRAYTCQKQFSLIKRLIKMSQTYFPIEEVKFTLKPVPVSSKKTKIELFKYPSGAIYRGEWLGGFRDGYGIMEWPDGSQYQGTWSFGYPYGFGKFTHADSEIYSGEWKNPFAGATLQQSCTSKNLDTIKNSIEDGYGNSYAAWLWYKEKSAETPTQPSKFSAEHQAQLKIVLKKIKSLENSIKNIRKTLETTFTENFEKSFKFIETEGGIKYKGEMVDGKREGKGINLWENGDKYLGYWKNDLQHGNGWNTWVDKSSYIGGYKSNNKHGIGEYIWEDGTKYAGEWEKNTINGTGKYEWVDGREYTGEWANGVMHGFGVFRSRDGKIYEGQWCKGKKHGNGYTINPDNSVSFDLWTNGKAKKRQ